MAGGFNIELLGVSEAFAIFDQLAPRVQLKALKPALAAGAEVMKRQVEADAPRFTGAMATHFHVFNSSSARKGVVTYAVGAGFKSELGIPETTKAGSPRGYYPTSIEYGWHPGNKTGSKRVTVVAARSNQWHKKGETYEAWKRLTHAEFGTMKVPANPFMFRAFHTSRSAAISAIAAELTTRIERMQASAQRGLDKAQTAADEAAFLEAFGRATREAA